MARIQHLYALALTLCLLGMAQSALAFSVKGSARFDAETQQFYLNIELPECDYSPNRPSGLQRGNLTRYIAIPGLDRYAASRRWEYGQEVVVRGSFRAQTSYAITVDGAICQSSGASTTTVATGAYPPAVEFLSKGLYFSKIEPYLRFRHRAVSAIAWTLYRIGKENRYLFSRTEGLKVHTLETTGESERMRKALPYLSYLEDYPGQRFTTSSQVPIAADWQVDALDLTPYYKEGDWLVVVARLPKADTAASTPSRGAAAADREADEADQDAEETDADATASAQASTPLANIVL